MNADQHGFFRDGFDKLARIQFVKICEYSRPKVLCIRVNLRASNDLRMCPFVVQPNKRNMKLLNAKQLCDVAAAKGFGVPALNNNGGSYDIGRAIIEAAQELQSPLIIAEYEPNLEYCGYDHAGAVIRMHAADTTIPMAIALDHGKTPQSILRAIRAGFTHVMIDYADKPMEENVRGTQQIIDLVRPLGISVEAEIGHIIKSSDDSKQRGGTA